MTTIPRTRLQRVLLVLLLVSVSIAAAGTLASFLMRAHETQMEQRMMVQPALPPGHPDVGRLPPGHPPIPQQQAPPETEGIRI